MKNNIVNKFIENSQNNNKIALIYKNKKISYDNLLKDIFKMINLFKSHNLKPNDKVLLFIIPSYNFYLCMLASIYYGLNIIVPLSFKQSYILKLNSSVLRTLIYSKISDKFI